MCKIFNSRIFCGRPGRLDLRLLTGRGSGRDRRHPLGVAHHASKRKNHCKCRTVIQSTCLNRQLRLCANHLSHKRRRLVRSFRSSSRFVHRSPSGGFFAAQPTRPTQVRRSDGRQLFKHVTAISAAAGPRPVRHSAGVSGDHGRLAPGRLSTRGTRRDARVPGAAEPAIPPVPSLGPARRRPRTDAGRATRLEHNVIGCSTPARASASAVSAGPAQKFR